MKQKQRQSADAEVEKAQAVEAEEIRVKTGVQTGVEALMADVQKLSLAEKDAKIDEVLKQYKSELEEKSAEIDAMKNSKKSFTDRSSKGDISKWGQDFMKAHLLGCYDSKRYEHSVWSRTSRKSWYRLYY